MRIKIIGDCESARALRGLLRKAGFAVTEVLPAELLKSAQGPAAGYVIRIEEYRAVDTGIHFDSIDCELEAAILRHVTQLSPNPVVVDRPGGQVHSDREIRIVVPAGEEREQQAVEFGVLRGLVDIIHGKAQPPALPVKQSWWSRFKGEQR